MSRVKSLAEGELRPWEEEEQMELVECQQVEDLEAEDLEREGVTGWGMER